MLCLFYDSKCINLSTFYNACTLKLTREVCHIFVCTCIAIFFQNIHINSNTRQELLVPCLYLSIPKGHLHLIERHCEKKKDDHILIVCISNLI